MSHIFVSYKTEDRAYAATLAAALEAEGWGVWWDRSIPAGKRYDDVIEDAIDSARCVIVLWTSRSVDSDWVRNEAQEGANREILVPILIEDVKIPLAFRRIQAANLVGWNGETAFPAFRRLVADINALVGPPAPATAPTDELPPSREHPREDLQAAERIPVPAASDIPVREAPASPETLQPTGKPERTTNGGSAADSVSKAESGPRNNSAWVGRIGGLGAVVGKIGAQRLALGAAAALVLAAVLVGVAMRDSPAPDTRVPGESENGSIDVAGFDDLTTGPAGADPVSGTLPVDAGASPVSPVIDRPDEIRVPTPSPPPAASVAADGGTGAADGGTGAADGGTGAADGGTGAAVSQPVPPDESNNNPPVSGGTVSASPSPPPAAPPSGSAPATPPPVVADVPAESEGTQTGPLEVSARLMEANVLERVALDYPEAARQAGIEGTVALRTWVGSDGAVQRVDTVTGHRLLTAAASEAVRQWRYRPYLENGSPVDVVTTVVVNFALRQPAPVDAESEALRRPDAASESTAAADRGRQARPTSSIPPCSNPREISLRAGSSESFEGTPDVTALYLDGLRPNLGEGGGMRASLYWVRTSDPWWRRAGSINAASEIRERTTGSSEILEAGGHVRLEALSVGTRMRTPLADSGWVEVRFLSAERNSATLAVCGQ